MSHTPSTTMEPAALKDSHENEDQSTGLQMQQILQLMSDRAAGKASSEQVEAAVQSLLAEASLFPRDPQQASTGIGSARNEPEIEVDEEDYDNVDSDDESPSKMDATKNSPEANESPPFASAATTAFSAVPAKRKRGRPRKTDAPRKPADQGMDWSVYADIPLGKQGAQMLTTFGDGPKPRPETVAACLLGARKMLQVSIQDARYLRRKQSNIFQTAKKVVKPQQKVRRGSGQPPAAESASAKINEAPRDEWTPDMLYRATVGFDRLSSAPSCGFDQEDLRLLYPEEMNAYQQWSRFHEEYAQKTKEDVPDEDKEDADGEKDDKSVGSEAPQPVTELGGHLAERLAQFDIRTDRMKDDWYLQFADLRQGSFLPRAMATKASQNKAWKEFQADKMRGRPKMNVVSWANMSLASARFLYWLGFDMETLPPPNNETTAALAYLAYDFYGRLVEKAIYLRTTSKKRRKRQGVEDVAVLLELGEGEQLEAVDIERALDDINPTPLYSAAAEKKVEPQLYFGPGFEERLEMEMEELLAGLKGKGLSEEEIQARRAEDELFSKMAEPPVTDGIASLLELQAGDGADDAKAGKRLKRK